MKLTTFILMIALAQVSAKGFGQKITLKVTNTPIEQVLQYIREQSGFEFIYNVNDLSGQRVTINLNKATVEDAVQASIRNLPLEYTIRQSNIVLTKKEPSFLDNLVARFSAIDIRGKIIGENDQVLAGANVKVKGTNRITKSDEKGEFYLAGVDEDAVLEISYIGFKALEIPVKGAVMPLEIKLNVATGELEEVNVTYSTGYQNIPKERTTGSFEFVDNKLLNRRVSSNILDRLQGVVSGMSFNRIEGSPVRTEISVRGRSTIFSNADPLIIVDNYPYEGDINNINPNDVESVTVLKDAAAASVWGTRAGNGVIVITTKNGKLNQQTRIGVNSNVTVSEKPDLFYLPKLKTTDIIDVESMLFGKGYYDNDIINTTTFPALSPVVEILLKVRNGQLGQNEANTQLDALRMIDNRNDYSKYSYKNSITQRHAINLSGGSAKTTYYFSSGYDKDILPLKDISERITANLKTTIYLTPKLTLSTDGFYAKSLNKLATLPAVGLSRYQYERPVDDNGNGMRVTRLYRKSFEDQLVSRGFLDWTYNPFEDTKLNNQQGNRNDLRLNLGAKYQIFDFLSFGVNYQFQKQDISNVSLNPENSYYTRDIINKFSQVDPVTGRVIDRPIPTGGILAKIGNELTANNGRAQLNLDKVWGDSRVSAMAGFEVSETKSSSDRFTSYGYDEATTLTKNVNYNISYTTYPLLFSQSIFGSPTLTSGNLDRFRSLFFSAAYSYKERYHVSLSARKDASNYFGVKANQRSVPLWSSGIKYDLDKEAFYTLKWLPVLKLRGTYGYTGNINKTVSALTTVQYLGSGAPYNLLTGTILNPPNPNLKWETVSTLNLGLDFGTKNNIISGSIEYYKKRGKDLIGDGPLDGTNGIINASGDSKFRGNIADIKAQGVDVEITTINIDKKIKWTSRFLFNYNIERVTKYNFKPVVTDILSPYAISPIVGQPVYSIRSYKWGGLDNVGDPLGYINNEISKDYSSLLNPSVEDLVYSGPTRPPYFGSVMNSFSFKGFSISANVIYKMGYVFRNQTITYGGLFTDPSLNGHSDYYKRWQKPGDEKITNVPALTYSGTAGRMDFYSKSEAVVERGDHIRLQDISLGYDFNNLRGKSKFLSGLSITGYINNLGILWKKSKNVADPDFVTNYPTPRSYSLSINAQF